MIRSIYGIYFIACIGHYIEVVNEQLSLLSQSGLLRKSKRLICFICKYTDEAQVALTPLFSPFRNIIIIPTTENLYERFAIENFRYQISDRYYYMYYIHTKGVSHPKNTKRFPITEMVRQNLNYFIIMKHHLCLYWLDSGYDAVGVALSQYPTVHFSGNFWWTKSEHVLRLPLKISNKYLAPEMFVCSIPNGKYISICQLTNNKPYNVLSRWSNEQIIERSTTKLIQNIFCKNMQY